MTAAPALVGIVGAGPAGVLTTLHLLRQSSQQVQGATGLHIVLLDPVERPGRGVAFGTRDERHLLNIPASRMSAYAEVPGHFVAWHRHVHGSGEPYSFLPRGRFGDYLAELLADAVATTPGATVEHRRTRAVGVDRTPAGPVLTLEDGGRLPTDAVVVATGLPPAGVGWAPADLRASPRFVPDPWRRGALDAIRSDVAGDVLVVGTGLTMVDVVLTLDGSTGRRVHAVSRSGRLPAAHAPRPVTPCLPDIDGWGNSLNGILAHARAHLSATSRTYGDWRPGVDGLRHRAAELWTRLDELDRQRFLASYAAAWNAVRHKTPPSSATRLRELRAAGSLTVEAAEVIGCRPVAHGLEVSLSSGRRLEVGWVVNCTGPHQDVRSEGDPLLADLLRDRPGGALAVPATAGMGLRTHDGRVLGVGGRPEPLWTLGALRRGELWESTAVPEIRVQAAAIARDILSVLATPVAPPDGLPRAIPDEMSRPRV